MAAHHHHHHHHQLLEEKSSRESNNNMMVSSSSSSFCYSDVVPHLAGVSNHHHHHHLQSFDSNPEIYNLTSGIEMIGFQPKPPNNNINNNNNNTHHHHDDDDHNEVQNPNDHLIVAQQQHHQHQNQEMGFMDESSLRPCVFSCEGNERPSQGLSLSLSSSNPSTISLQSFELRHSFHQRFNLSSPSSNSRDGFLGKSQSFHQHEQHDQQQPQQQQQQQIFLGKSIVNGSASSSNSMSLQFELMRNSKYMGPTQELLIEFCNLGTKQNSDESQRKKQPLKKNKEQWEFEEGEEDGDHNNNNNNTNNASSSSSSRNANTNPSLYGVSLLELQKRKTKLLAMLEELDRRYKNYCEQMKGVVSSFEAVAGPRAANVYSALASKAMSRHFRCLRDSIVAQIKATKKAMGEKDSNNATILGTTRGETPRLRILDQNLRQQRAYQQMTMMESHPWRPQRGLPERSVSILRAWLFEHFLHPYPSDVDKHILARQTGLTRSQVSNWFINARVRLWKPMVEQMYLEETKEQQDKNMGSSSDGTDHQLSCTDHLGGILPPPPPPQDQKPDPDQLIRIDPGSLSSIVNTTTTTTTTTSNRDDPQNRINHHLQFQQSSQFIGRVEGFGSMEHLDFPSSSSYNQQNHHATPFGSNTNDQNDNNTPHQTFGGGGGGNNNNVSLTLGLQQHDGNGVSLAFSPASQTAASLFYPRDHMDDCQQVHHQYSLLDGDQGQNLPYRNLMGAQVLQDFA